MKKFENILNNFPGSKKNRPPGDPPGGPKSLLEVNKSLLQMKFGGSDAFFTFHARFLADLEEKNDVLGSFLEGFQMSFARCLDIAVHLGTP